MFLGFFRLGVLAIEVGERHVQRFAASKIAIHYSAAPRGNFWIADQPDGCSWEVFSRPQTFGGTCLTLKWLAGIVDLFYHRRG